MVILTSRIVYNVYDVVTVVVRQPLMPPAEGKRKKKPIVDQNLVKKKKKIKQKAHTAKHFITLASESNWYRYYIYCALYTIPRTPKV